VNKKANEREFIHDLSASIGAAIFMGDVMLDEITEAGGDLEKIEMIVTSLKNAKGLIEQRRNLLVQEDDLEGLKKSG
jgi:hypothetical protein